MSLLREVAGCIVCLSRLLSIGCSCLQSSRLLVVLFVAYVVFHSSQAKYSHDTGTFYTYNCNTTWCGEQWRRNRMLRYGYDVTDELVVETKVHIVHENNCSGTQSSLNCDSRTVVKNETRPTRVKTIVRSTNPGITVFPAINLYLITTDNINESTNTYPINQDLVWQFHIPRSCKMIVTFSQFDLEVSDRCRNDYFSVQTSKNQQDIYRYCNNLNRIEIRRRRRVQFTFHSNYAVAKSGIKATVCLSNLKEHASEKDLFPCTCVPSSNRRKRSPISKSPLQGQKIEEAKVSEWLRRMMQGGEQAVEDILRQPESPRQRHLAEQYQRALNAHEEW